MNGFGFDIGSAKGGGSGHRSSGGHKGSHKGHGHHHHRHHLMPPDDGGGDGGDGGGGDDGSGDDGSGYDDGSGDGGDMGAEFHRHAGECTCGGVCASCQAGGARRIGWRGHYGPDLYESNHLAPMSGDPRDPNTIGYTGHYGPDIYASGHNRPMGEEEDDFGCDPLGSCGGAYARMKASQYGWEYDGPGVFGGDLTPPILSNWGRYPSRSPLKGVFAGDLSMPILSNWGRYPSRSPLKGVFAGDDDFMNVVDAVGSVAQATAAVAQATRGSYPQPPPPPPPPPVQRINSDANPTTSGQGGVVDAVNAVARGTSSVIAATKGQPYPGGPMMMPMDTITAPRPHPHHRRARPMQPLPYYGQYYASPVIDSYSPMDVYGRPGLAPAYNANTAYVLALRANPYYRDPGY